MRWTYGEYQTGLNSKLAHRSPNTIRYFLSVEDLSGTDQNQFTWRKIKYSVRHPVITHASKKKAKSDVSVLSLSLEDPASNDGMIKISEKLVPFVPTYPSGVHQKTIVFGDQGYVERGNTLQIYAS